MICFVIGARYEIVLDGKCSCGYSPLSSETECEAIAGHTVSNIELGIFGHSGCHEAWTPSNTCFVWTDNILRFANSDCGQTPVYQTHRLDCKKQSNNFSYFDANLKFRINRLFIKNQKTFLALSQYILLDANCQVSYDFKSGGLHCRKDGSGRHDCLNKNIGYSDLGSAWKTCGEVLGCERIMKYRDRKFYLRRSNDPKFQDSRVQYVDFRCPGNR